jgi:PAS domain S-box-containing protein
LTFLDDFWKQMEHGIVPQMITSRLHSYWFALAMCIGAATLSWILNAPSSCFHLAIVICCLYGGRRAGLLATGLASLSFDYFFLPPQFSFLVERSAYPRFAAFIATAVCINLVIAAKQRGDRARREVEEQYRVISETAPDGVLSTDHHGRVLLVNSSATRIFGYSVTEMLDQPITRFVPHSCSEVSSSVTEMPCARKDGTQFVAEVSFGNVVANNKCAAVVFVRDITERKRNELELRRSEAYLAEAERMSHIGSWAWNPATRANTYWSAEMYRIHQLDPLRGPLSLEEKRAVRPPEDWEHLMASLERSIREKIDLDCENRLVFPDGSIKYIHTLGHPVIDAAGNVVELFGITRDVTEQQHARAARDALQKMEARLARASQIATLGEISASIAHEINQPLTAIIANAHMCSDSLSSNCVSVADARSLIQEILECGYHATEVVQRMRTLFKGGTFERATLDINDVAREVCNLMRSEAGKRRVDLEIDLETELPKILGDRVQIQQVLVNLCINGFDAMDSLVDRPRKLSVRTRVHGSAAIRVEIQDSGIGLREPDRIFEAFFTTKQNGMGMGLPICRSIIELHEGHLWPRNDKGPGTTFCFTLPVPDHRTSEPQRRNGRHRSDEDVSVGHSRPKGQPSLAESI